MPLFMEVHSLSDPVVFNDIAHAHAADLQHREAHHARYLRYWVDEPNGKIFCLVNTPAEPAEASTARPTVLVSGVAVGALSASALFPAAAHAVTTVTLGRGVLAIHGDSDRNSFIVGRTPVGVITLNGAVVPGASSPSARSASCWPTADPATIGWRAEAATTSWMAGAATT